VSVSSPARDLAQLTSGTNHFKNAGSPSDAGRAAEYDTGAYVGFRDEIQKGLAAPVPPDADVAAVADPIVKVVDMAFGTRPSARTSTRLRMAVR